MRKVIAFLFCSLYIFVAIIPCTSVLATEVTWGDNNTYTMSNSDYDLIQKVAIMSLIPDLLSSGINELSIENATDVDDFVDSFIEYINSHADDFTNVSTWSTLNELNQAIQEKTQEIGNNLLQNGGIVQNTDGTLHSFFEPQNNNTQNYKVDYKPNPNFVPILNRMSRLTNSNPTPEPVPHPDFSYLDNIAYLYVRNMEFVQNISIPWCVKVNGQGYSATFNFDRNKVTYYSPSTYLRHTYIDNNYMYYGTLGIYNGILKVNFNTETLQAEYYGAVPFSGELCSGGGVTWSGNSLQNWSKNYGSINGVGMLDYLSVDGSATNSWTPRTDFTGAGLSTFCNYIYNQFANIDIYVDGDPWVICSTNEPIINIDINGMDLYGGTDKPVTYYYPNGTQIDYQKLYEVIKRAIQNNTPISNQTIWEGDTYYDSHDTVYSPTIYNYYSDDDEDESSIIDEILTLAIIPEFDTALLEPLETPMLNGEKIMFTGVQAIPEDILFVLGACFVLVLFGAMINRLIE